MSSLLSSFKIHSRALHGTVFFIPLPLNFWPLPPAPAMFMSTPARTHKTLRIYDRTIIEMHWFYVFSGPAGENASFYRLLIKRFMDNWETSPNVILALLCLCAVKTFFELPFHIIYWHPVARLHPDPQCCQVGNVVLSYQKHKIIVYWGKLSYTCQNQNNKSIDALYSL